MKTILRQNIRSNKEFKCNYDKMVEKQLGSKYYYLSFIKCQQPTQVIAEKWQTKLNMPIDREFICKIFENIKVVTLNTKLRSFHFRLLHHSIVTNEKLFRWKILDTDKCTFCNVAVENTFHLIWECQVAKTIWDQIKTWVKNSSNRTLNLNLKNIVFCRLTTNPMDWVNTLCIIVMQYLYSSRCLKVIPNFARLKSQILDMHNLEKYIAVKNNKLKKHENKWKYFKT